MTNDFTKRPNPDVFTARRQETITVAGEEAALELWQHSDDDKDRTMWVLRFGPDIDTWNKRSHVAVTDEQAAMLLRMANKDEGELIGGT